MSGLEAVLICWDLLYDQPQRKPKWIDVSFLVNAELTHVGDSHAGGVLAAGVGVVGAFSSARCRLGGGVKRRFKLGVKLVPA
jgi:hypothetical protein